MKKYYRIFEIINGVPTITKQLEKRTNWYDSESDADKGINEWNQLPHLLEEDKFGKKFTILPVYDADDE